MNKRVAFIVVLIICLVILVTSLTFLTNNEYSTIQIFPGNQCQTACWMGLMPGESTAADVERLLTDMQSHLGRWGRDPYASIDSRTGYIINGQYHFTWLNYDENSFPQYVNYIQIKESRVDSILLFAGEQIRLGEVLDLFGLPDDIQFTSIDQNNFMLIIAYIEELIRIRFLVSQDCSVSNLIGEAHVEAIVYHSRQNAVELVETEYGYQPRLLAYQFSVPRTRQIPADVFQSWTNREVNSACSSAIYALPDMVNLPPIPEQESTELPIPTSATATNVP